MDLMHDFTFGTRFFGDYNGLAAREGNVYAIWTDTRAMKRGPQVAPDQNVGGPFFQQDDFLVKLIFQLRGP